MNRRAISLIFVALLAIVSVAGCGGSGEAAPLSKAQFVRQADAICRHAEDQREKALGEATEQSAGSGPKQAVLVTEAALPPIRMMAEELAELGVPSGDEKEVQAIVVEFERGITTLEENPTSVSADVTAFSDATESAEAYGLTSCGI